MSTSPLPTVECHLLAPLHSVRSHILFLHPSLALNSTTLAWTVPGAICWQPCKSTFSLKLKGSSVHTQPPCYVQSAEISVIPPIASHCHEGRIENRAGIPQAPRDFRPVYPSCLTLCHNGPSPMLGSSQTEPRVLSPKGQILPRCPVCDNEQQSPCH